MNNNRSYQVKQVKAVSQHTTYSTPSYSYAESITSKLSWLLLAVVIIGGLIFLSSMGMI